MRKIAFLLPVLVLSLSAWAQKPGPGKSVNPAGIAGLSREELEAYRKSLNITAAQKQKLKAVEQKFSKQMRAIFDKYKDEQAKLRQTQGGGTSEERMALEGKRAADMRPLVDAYQKETRAVYTPEQRKKMEAFQSKTRALLLKSLKKPAKGK